MARPLACRRLRQVPSYIVVFRCKPLAALSIVLILASALGSWHAPDDGDDFAPVGVHHHSDHDARFSAASHPKAPEHCALCHWLRALGNGTLVATSAQSVEPSQLIRAGAWVAPVHSAARLSLSSRAPPRA